MLGAEKLQQLGPSISKRACAFRRIVSYLPDIPDSSEHLRWHLIAKSAQLNLPSQ